jgi:AbrB family looped-hinge helix DNA binding protein
MYKATVRLKGQLTIPKVVRERLGFEPGDRVIFGFDDDSVRLRAVRRQSVESLFSSLTGTDLPYPDRHEERTAARKALSDRLQQG